MAYDKSEPRVGLIFQIGLFAVLILVGIRGALVSYFDNIAYAEEHRKIVEAVPAALISLRADEDQRLKSGAMPIDQAMAAIVAHGRMGASPDIMPSASKDVGPMQGWMKMPNEVPAPMLAALLNDGGAPVAPAASVAPDAGAPHAAPGVHGPLAPTKPAKK
jgi:hypothetical protein